jgi:hypothetical protein
MRNISNIRNGENQNTHFVFCNFFSEICAFYEIKPEDLREMGIEGWRRKAQYRDQWRRIAQEAEAHVGL